MRSTSRASARKRRISSDDVRAQRWRDRSEIPAETAESKAMSKGLKANGFRFVGPTVCYAFMQACGLVQDHVASCFRYLELGGTGPDRRSPG